MHDLTPADRIRLIEAIEAEMKRYPQLEIRVEHHFAGGVYERECFIPAGSLITGKVHKTEHLAKLACGRMRLVSGYGGGIIDGPITIQGKAGDKKIAFAETYCRFSTFHAVGSMTDIKEIERIFVCATVEEFNALGYKEKGQLRHAI